MNKFIFSFLSFLLLSACSDDEIRITKQGNFSVGGTTLQRDGTYDNSKFVSWAEQVETGQSYRGDHAFVDYQIPVKANKYPLIFVHGYGGSGVCWEMTPDGRDGFSTLMLRKKYSTYVMDLPGRGRAGRTTAFNNLKPIADEMFWFDIWRIGLWPNYNEGVQFSKDKEYLSQFFREMTPDLSNHKLDIPAINALADKIGNNILVTHSAGGYPGWVVAMQNSNVKGVAAFEPGGFIFPKGEALEPMPSLTGTLSGVEVSTEEFKKLTEIPIVIYFGDYIPEEPSQNLGDENWRVRLAMAKKFVETINKHGGNATLVELPKLGIKGNTHFLMQDLNNNVIANLFDKWLEKNKLK